MPLTDVANALLSLWLVLAAPSSSPSFAAYQPGDVGQIRQPQSARFRIEGIGRAGVVPFSLRGEGAFVRPDRVEVTLEAIGQKIEQKVIGSNVYVRQSTQSGWEFVDLAAGGNPLSAPTALPSSVDLAGLQALGNTETVGFDVVDGVSTQHYRGTADLSQALNSAVTERPRGLVFRAFNLSFDYWIGIEDRYIRRIEFRMQVQPPAQLGLPVESLSAALRVNVFDFDQAISIEAPEGAGPLTVSPRSPRSGPAPVQAPAQAPARMPGRLPNTGETRSGWGAAFALSLLALAMGWGIRRYGAQDSCGSR